MPGVNRNAPRVDSRMMAVTSRGYARVRAGPLIVQNTRPCENVAGGRQRRLYLNANSGTESLIFSVHIYRNIVRSLGT